MFRRFIDVIVLRAKVRRGVETFSPMETDSADALVKRPIGRFAWTNRIYLQTTLPGSSTEVCSAYI